VGAHDLAFRVFTIDDSTIVFKRISAAMAETGAVAEKTSAKTLTAAGAFQKFASAGAAAAVLAVGAGLKMAADFETQATTLVTSAGESEQALGMVGAGVRRMATETGTSTQQLIKGLYIIESAGYHGGKGLEILGAAARGARAENADLGVVANAVTTAFKGFSAQGYTATDVVNALTATVQQGKTNLQELAGALATVSPAASTAGIAMTQMLGAMSVMTAAGVSADKAATGLRMTILSLEAPTAKQRKVMEGLGLDATDLSKNLGSRGLVGTLQMVLSAIKDHMGPAGTVLIDSLNKAAASGTDFESQLQKTLPTQRSYVGALADMFGGIKSLQGALILAADSGKPLAAATQQIADKVKEHKGEIMGWAEVQGTLNLKLDVMQARVKDVVLGLGQSLIPAASAILKIFSDWLPLIMKVGPWLLVFAVAIKAITLATKAWAFIQAVVNGELLANPVGLIIVAVAALATGILYLATKTQFFQVIWHGLQAAFEAVAGAMVAAWDTVTGALYTAWDAVTGTFSAVGGAVSTAWGAVENAFSTAIDFITGVVETAWPYVLGLLTGGLGLAIYEIVKHWDDIKHAFSVAVSAIGNFLKREWPIILLTILTGGMILVAALIYRNWDSIVDFFVKLPGRIVRMLGSAGNWLLGVGEDILAGLLAGLGAAWDAVVDFFVRLPGRVWGFLKNAGNWLLDIGKNILAGLLAGIVWYFENVVKRFYWDLPKAILKLVAAAPSWLYNTGMSIISGMLSGIVSIAVGFPGWFARNIKDPTVRFFTGAPGWLFDHGKDLIGGLLSGAWDILKGIGGWLRHNVYDAIVDAIVDLFDIGSPSRVMMGLGGHMMEGLLRGLIFSARNIPAVVKKALGGILDIAGGILGLAAKGGGKLLDLIFGAPGGYGGAAPRGIIQSYAMALLKAHGWGNQWGAFDALEKGEAGWVPSATNPTSGAYGLPQALPASKLDAYGDRRDYRVQLRWMMNYIGSTYRDPANAYATWLSRTPHWYGEGGIFLHPSIIGVGERGPEAVIPLGRGGRFGREVHVHFHGGTFVGTDKTRLGREMRDILRDSLRGDGRHEAANSL
jgi:TP901 family phage tail tape measure protein